MYLSEVRDILIPGTGTRVSWRDLGSSFMNPVSALKGRAVSTSDLDKTPTPSTSHQYGRTSSWRRKLTHNKTREKNKVGDPSGGSMKYFGTKKTLHGSKAAKSVESSADMALRKLF